MPSLTVMKNLPLAAGTALIVLGTEGATQAVQIGLGAFKDLPKNMRRLLSSATTTGLAFLSLNLMSSAQAATIIGGITFDDNAFADSLISSCGSFTTSGDSIESVLTDKAPGTYALSFSPGAFVELGFTDNFLVNGPGNDLALFELGIPDTFKLSLTVGGVTQIYGTVDTGESAAGFSSNLAEVNLDDFSIAPGASLSSVVVGLDATLSPGGEGTVPSLSLVGAINSRPVPEPSSILGLLAFGALGAGSLLKRKQQQKSSEKG